VVFQAEIARRAHYVAHGVPPVVVMGALYNRFADQVEGILETSG
jgi:hypothetical protein